MKIFIVDYWMPFPNSEYGGLQCVVAVDEEHCVELIIEDADLSAYHKRDIPDWQERIRNAVQQAKVFELAEDYRAEVVEEFIT